MRLQKKSSYAYNMPAQLFQILDIKTASLEINLHTSSIVQFSTGFLQLTAQ